MRTIENINQGKVIDTFYVFQSDEERNDYIHTQRESARRDHRKKLEEIRSAYMESLQTEPAFGDSAYIKYMTGIKQEFERFFAQNAKIEKDLADSLLEADLARSV